MPVTVDLPEVARSTAIENPASLYSAESSFGPAQQVAAQLPRPCTISGRCPLSGRTLYHMGPWRARPESDQGRVTPLPSCGNSEKP